MSQALVRSTAPPITPPCTAAITGKRACSRQEKLCCSRRTSSRNFSAAVARSTARGATPSPCVNTDRSMPALKCLPVEEITRHRVAPSALSSSTIAGSSFQKARTMLLKLSGRLSTRCATAPSRERSKQVGVMPATLLRRRGAR